MPMFTTTPRNATHRSKLPQRLAPQIPTRGIYAAGGGLVSSAWRVSLDLDARTLSWGQSRGSGSSSIGPMDKEATVPVDEATLHKLVTLAEAAWQEPAPSEVSEPTVDYSELLVVSDGEEVFYHDGYGPIRRPGAAALLKRLRALAGM